MLKAVLLTKISSLKRHKKLIKPDKSLGQHFLKNESTILKICDQSLCEYEHIVEVGPGPITLTKHLVEKSPLTVIEKDNRFLDLLETLTPKPTIIFEDALKVTQAQINPQNKKTWLVSNLPYNISSLLLVKFLEWNTVDAMTLMFQKEVGEKVLDSFKGNSLGFLTRAYFETKNLMKLKPGAFSPPPEVDSIVINFIRRPSPLVSLNNFNQYQTFLRNIFMHPRKQIFKRIQGLYQNIDLKEFLVKNNIPLTIRAQELTLETAISLFEAIRKKYE